MPTDQALTERPWLRIEQAAERAQVSIATLRREIRAGRLRAVKVGGRKALRLTPAMVDAWLLAFELPASGAHHV
jgi:excisionase family DNA binding protein